MRILLAEHDRELHNALGFVLRGEGHEVVDADDGSEALEELASLIMDGDRNQFDLIMSAQSIPGIPGLSIVAGLRSRGRRTPFILMTNNTAVQSRARDLGAVILDGPLNVETIRGAIRQAEATALAIFTPRRPYESPPSLFAR